MVFATLRNEARTVNIIQVCRKLMYIGGIATGFFLLSSLFLLFSGISTNWGLFLIGFVPATVLITFGSLIIVTLGRPNSPNEGKDSMTPADLYDDPPN